MLSARGCVVNVISQEHQEIRYLAKGREDSAGLRGHHIDDRGICGYLYGHGIAES
jgi:hypothetical protein